MSIPTLPKFPRLTIFHSARNPTSRAALSMLQRMGPKAEPTPFDVDVVGDSEEGASKTGTTATPTQLRSLIGYLGFSKEPYRILVPEAPKVPDSGVNEVVSLLKRQPKWLITPIVVDWAKGKAVIADPPEKAIPLTRNVGD
ncbi:hypothetical protein BJ684DRAFT_14262 [Piptocephalis cylindrospora]|uniref:Thioredoxin-like protein n=1 Tax=Piptocephalis cylindrospora TaxID=1907219 RepID=A0A4P9Y8K1_9FUNG|nr:hypothetical protein BJ684DRAFT_14262 [Piptocephalis cylindrospora]|eukprot:RKP15506.1 hypothetical protein BJ684DRAFT_14262 [Piptocephalis cylindrospora]